ncbi:MAG: hypothetical protein AAGI63_14255 [Planctomycetota bacterium]
MMISTFGGADIAAGTAINIAKQNPTTDRKNVVGGSVRNVIEALAG